MRNAILVAVILTTALPASADHYKDGAIARRQAATLKSLDQRYIDPCQPRAQETRRYWHKLKTNDLDNARGSIERYRNVLSCKAIHIYDVPGHDKESDFWKLLDAGDTTGARRVAAELYIAATKVTIDKAFVGAKIAQIEAYAADTKLGGDARALLGDFLADAKAEFAAARYGSAQIVLREAFMAAMSAGARPPTSPCSKSGKGNATRGC